MGGQDPRRLFEHYDRNNSGTLELTEFSAAVRKGGGLTTQVMSDKELEAVFRSADADADGHVDIDELTAFVWADAAEEGTPRFTPLTLAVLWPLRMPDRQVPAMLEGELLVSCLRSLPGISWRRCSARASRKRSTPRRGQMVHGASGSFVVADLGGGIATRRSGGASPPRSPRSISPRSARTLRPVRLQPFARDCCVHSAKLNRK